MMVAELTLITQSLPWVMVLRMGKNTILLEILGDLNGVRVAISDLPSPMELALAEFKSDLHGPLRNQLNEINRLNILNLNQIII